ncbi:hypothetical protein [Acidithiobacillus sp.]|uniref:Y-family DNA polymerase n=1 Tax=Acidithiobacillus sp. TaxID=1872118 RepID=UPI003457915C
MPHGFMESETVSHARKIIHIDMDAFFAAIEQRDHPEWKGLPVIVGGAPQRSTIDIRSRLWPEPRT